MAFCGQITRWGGSEAAAGARLMVAVREHAGRDDGVVTLTLG
jgi:hypothetical protein